MFSFFRFFLSLISGSAHAYVVNIPDSDHKDVNIPVSTRVDGGEEEIYSMIDFINENLRFIIGVVLFAAVLFAGYKLTTSKSEGLTKAKDILIGGGVGILVAIFSYLLVRIIVNLL